MNYQEQFRQIVIAYSGQQNMLVVPRYLIEFIGSYEGAALLSQMLFWSGKTEDGWFWKTHEQWNEELALSEYQVRKLVKKFKQMGFLETKFKKAYDRPVIYYRIDFGKLVECYKNTMGVEEPQETNLRVEGEQNLRVEGEESAGLTVEKVQGLYLHRLPTEITKENKERKEYKEKKESRKFNDLLFTVEEKKKADKELEMFNAFWKAYPKKQKRAVALKCWQKLKVDEELFTEIMAGLDRLKQSRQWREQDGKFIPMPSTFLNERRWEDEPEVDKQALVQKSNVLEEQRVKRVYELTPEHPPFHDDIGNTLKWMELVKEWEAKYGMTFQEWEDKNGPLREYMRKHYGRG